MKKIAIITYSRAYNYGSALQAYALNKFLRTNGFEVKTIDYTTKGQQSLYRIFEPIKNIMSIARNIQSLLNYAKLKRHKLRFDTFVSECIPMTDRIHSDAQLEYISREFDYFICGSDQIWNANCADFDSNYMLSFVGDKSKCIAYAPSLGAGAKGFKTSDAIEKFVVGYKSLSSREITSSAIISRICNKPVCTVCDPVFLLSEREWMEIVNQNPIGKDYILGYFIGDVAGLRKFAAKVQKEAKLPVLVIYKNLRDLRYSFTNKYDSGPKEFVSLVRNASFVVTNSFHAVSFSLKFRKNFWVFVNNASIDTRISGILNMVNLTERILTEESMNTVNPLQAIDYTNLPMDELNEFIMKSKEYLISNLS